MISIRRLHKRFIVSDGAVAAVKSLDLEIAEGELFVIGGTDKCSNKAIASRSLPAKAIVPR
jgi:hypothetical protein